jgi:prophage regulatory protein
MKLTKQWRHFMEAHDSKGRFIRNRDLRSIVPYSEQQIRRLEAAGKFPRRVRLGANRVAWLKDEVEQWLAVRVLER